MKDDGSTTGLLSFGNGRMAVVSFIAAPLHDIHAEIDRWSPISGYAYRVRQDLGWRDVFSSFVTPRNRCALIATMSRWTAFVDNDKIGNWPLSELIVMSERLRTECCAITVSREQAKPTARGFGYWDGRSGECRERTVVVIHDQTWEFHESGQVLPIEHRSCYSNRLKRERLTNEMAIEYLRKLGIDLDPTSQFLNERDQLVFDCLLIP